MPSRQTLPFERGTTQSTPGLEGATFWDSTNKQHLIVCRNTDAAALTAKRLVKWEDRDVFQVDYTTAANHGPLVAGVVDPLLTATVPVNANFYVVAGVCTVALGTGASATIIGDYIQPSADADKGKVDPALLSATGGGSLEIGYLRNQCGVALALASFNNNVEVDLQPRIKWWSA
ncbi:MAG: hypothetical protein ACYS9X_17895 [Planctomycetota bacterium]|jgi:hypothetical protein